MEVINLAKKLAAFDDLWAPKIISRHNGNDIMLVKVKGEFTWHSHDANDDLFYVIKGQLHIDRETGPVTVNPGEMCVIPRGVMHRPVAEEETHVLLIERSGEPNTGDPETAAEKIYL